MLSDIGNKSSVSFFIITKVAKEEYRGSCCSRQNYYMTCKNQHRSTTVLEEIELDHHWHIARLAWLIQGYLFLVKNEPGPTLKIQ